MSTIDCSACNDLRNYAPNFVQNGVDDIVAASLKNNTGLNPGLAVLHNDCEDLNDVNDCLIGRMTDELEAYDVCDWKDFMKKHNSNLYETLKAMIAALCGALCAAGAPLVSYVRASGSGGPDFWWTPAQLQSGQSVHIRPDSINGDDGVLEADKPYLCSVSLCANMEAVGPSSFVAQVLATSSGETITPALFNKRAQHIEVYTDRMSAIPLTCVCNVAAGEHLVLTCRIDEGNLLRGRLHQIVVTWQARIMNGC